MYSTLFVEHRLAIALTTLLAGIAVLAACSSNEAPTEIPPTEQANQTSGVLRAEGVLAPPMPCRLHRGQQVEINGVFYSPEWGPIRSDMVRVEALSETGLEAQDNRECTKALPENIYRIAETPIEQVFAEIRSAQNGNGSHEAGRACLHRNRIYAFSATTSSKASATGPLVDLSAQGLLQAGWPFVSVPAPDGRNATWHTGITIRYEGREYVFSGHNRLSEDEEVKDRLDPESLIHVDTIAVDYSTDRWASGMVSAIPHIALDGEITDFVKIYRPHDRPADDVIVIDPCPTYPEKLQPDNIIFWVRVADEDVVGVNR